MERSILPRNNYDSISGSICRPITQLVYAPVPKVILFILISFLPAILFGAEATSQFKLSLPGLCLPPLAHRRLHWDPLLVEQSGEPEQK